MGKVQGIFNAKRVRKGKEAYLTLEDAAGALNYDPETGFLTWRTRCGMRGKPGARAGCQDKNSGYRVVSIHGNLFKEHRVAWLIFHGSWPEEQIDHINGDKSDNRIVNLREATPSQNLQNKSAPLSNNQCGHLGVHFHKASGRFRVIVTAEGKRHEIGKFKTVEEAKTAYDTSRAHIQSRAPKGDV